MKPAALCATSSQTSTLIEGSLATSHDIMRGVIRSDSFHAAPAVFSLRGIENEITVEEGAPLAEFFPCPRSLQESTFTMRAGGVAAAFARSLIDENGSSC